MKTLIDIDEQLLKQAMELTGAKTKKQAVHDGLEELVRKYLRQELVSMKGHNILDLSIDELKDLRKKRTNMQNLDRKPS